MYKIALVEDEDALRELLAAYLRREGWEVFAYEGVRSAWKHLNEEIHLWVLDLMLPDGNGFELLRAVKQHHADVPVIMISARDQELDRVIGLEMGSDDYLPKPFLPQELVIRARKLMNLVYKANGAGNGSSGFSNGNGAVEYGSNGSMAHVVGNIAANGTVNGASNVAANGTVHSPTSLESTPAGQASWIVWEPYQIDPVRRCAWYNNELIDLTTKEFDLLLTFSQHKGQAFSREQLLFRVWGDDFVGSDRVVDDLVRRLRKKCPALRLETLYGFGYRAV